MKMATRCVHAGYQPEEATGAVNMPIYATSTYAYRRFGEHRGWEYSRTGNPTRQAAERAVAELEGGADGIAFASGLAAIDALTDMLEPGDHIVAANDLYGGSYRLFTSITSRHGVDVTLVEATDPEAFQNAMTSATKIVFAETPTNPTMRIVDLEALERVAHSRGALLVVDNTFLTPALQRPLDLGADVVVHSTTKYLNGHSDGIGGVIVTRDPDLGEQLHTIQNSVGAIMGPFEAFLVLRGLKTLAVRMAAHEANGRQLAELLRAREAVKTVYYPGLPDHPQHELAVSQQSGFGAMIAFDLGSLARARAFCEAVRVFTLAESLGGVESLVSHPATMTHAAVPVELRERLGIGDGMIRLSVGIEDGADLAEDVDRGLSAAGRAV
jgi:O-succinylhomoserine (thiol)-lyase